MAQYLLVDGKNLLFRAGHASRNLKTSDGRMSGAIHGFLRMISFQRIQHPDAEIVILWEGDRQVTYRHRLFPSYKMRFKPGDAPSEVTTGIHNQIKGVKDVCEAIGLRWIEVPGLEADDLAGMLSVYLSYYRHEVLLLSGDRDWWQLAPIPGVTVICEQGTGRDEPILTDERVMDKFGVKANQLLKFRPFVGDTSDKIPPCKSRFLAKHALKLVAAGVNPKKLLHEQPSEIRHFNGVEEWWPNYVRNYKLMKIARSPEDCQLSVEAYDTMVAAVVSAPLSKNYRDMVRVLAEWELNDAIARRDFLFRLSYVA